MHVRLIICLPHKSSTESWLPRREGPISSIWSSGPQTFLGCAPAHGAKPWLLGEGGGMCTGLRWLRLGLQLGVGLQPRLEQSKVG